MNVSKKILPIIIISQFCCTTLWFAGNGIMGDLIVAYNLNIKALGHLTSIVQVGFIVGTLLFALFTVVDRFSPSKVFFFSALLGALFNFFIVLKIQNLISLLIFRFFTGFFLAGIYPVGMKIATDYYNKKIGKSLSFLVAALVLGTALPHLLKDIMQNFSWENIIIVVSLLSCFGGFLILIFVKDGPFRAKSKELNLSTCFSIFKNNSFKKAAFGYFAHMWELYTFWAFVPVFLDLYKSYHKNISFNVPLLTFLIIAIGSIACILGSYLTTKFTVKKIAYNILFLSCLCCIIFPFLFFIDSKIIFLSFLFFWGMVVIADSPLFSTLIAQNAPLNNKGTALTIVNCIGFTITIISLQSITYLFTSINSPWVFIFLAIGPIFGILSLKRA